MIRVFLVLVLILALAVPALAAKPMICHADKSPVTIMERVLICSNSPGNPRPSPTSFSDVYSRGWLLVDVTFDGNSYTYYFFKH